MIEQKKFIGRKPEVPVPITAIETFFNKLDGLSLRAAHYIYYLEFGFKKNEKAFVSHTKLAKVTGSARPSVSKALAPPCSLIDASGIDIVPLIAKSRPDDKGCSRYNIPAGSVIRGLASGSMQSERSNIFGIRSFFMEWDKTNPSWLNKKTGLSIYALKLVPYIELMRCDKSEEWYSLNKFIRSEKKKSISIVGRVIPLPRITRKERLRNAIHELADLRSPETNNPIILINKDSKTLEWRAFTAEDEPKGYHLDPQTLPPTPPNVTTSTIPKGYHLDPQTLPPTPPNVTTNLPKGDHQHPETLPKHNVVVVLKTTTKGEVTKLNGVSEFFLEFGNGDQKLVKVRDVVDFELALKIASGKQPTSSTGGWGPFEGFILNLIRDKGIGIGIAKNDGYNIGAFVEHMGKERIKEIGKPLNAKIREIVNNGMVAQMDNKSQRLFILKITNEGVMLQYGESVNPHSNGEAVPWREYYKILTDHAWEIESLEKELDEKKVTFFDERSLKEHLQTNESCELSNKKGSLVKVLGMDYGDYSIIDNGVEKTLNPMLMNALIITRDMDLKFNESGS